MSKERSEQELVRRESLKKLRELGINCYPAELFKVNNNSKQIKDKFKDGEELNVVIAGRLMSRRIMGKASFAELQDSSGRIQLYVNRDEGCECEDKTLYNQVFKKLLDIGDIIGVEGESSSGWILVDCGDVVINIMKQEQREFYDLESLWGEMMPSKESI